MGSVHDIGLDLWRSAQPVLQRAHEGAGTAYVQLSSTLRPALDRLLQAAEPLLGQSKPVLDRLDAGLQQYRPWQLVLVSALTAWLLLWLWRALCTATADVREKGGPYS